MDRSVRCYRTAALCAVFVLVAVPSRSHADWPSNGARMTVIGTSSASTAFYSAAVASDKSLLVEFGLSPTTIIARRSMDGRPVPGWPVTEEAGAGTTGGLAPDQLGGCYYALAAAGYVIVHHVLADGTSDPAWPPHGVTVCDAPGFKHAGLAPDASGGVYVTWTDARDEPDHLPHAVFGSHLLSNGSVGAGWDAGGTRLADLPDTTVAELGACRPDGVGGVVVIAAQITDFGGPDRRTDGFLLHLSPHGSAPGWPAGGLFPPDLPLHSPFAFDTDGSGGAFVMWNDGAAGAHVQRFTGAGDIASGWPAGGRRIVADTTLTCIAFPFISDGGDGSRFILFSGTSGDLNEWAGFVGALDGSGTSLPGWPSPGCSIPTRLQSAMTLAPDGDEGCYALWGNFDVSGYLSPELRVLRVRSDGTVSPDFPGAGLVVCEGSGLRYQPSLAPDGGGGVYAVWLDSRDSPYGSYDVYATRIGPDGGALTDVPPSAPVAGALTASPNPFTHDVSFALPPNSGDARLEIFDASGRRVRSLASRSGAAATGRMEWDGEDEAGRPVAPGLYLVRGQVGGSTVSTRVVRVF